MSKADISETGTPFILYGELYTTYKEVATEIKRKTNCIVDKKYLSKIGDVVIPTSGETSEEIATATCVMTPNVILAGDLNIFRINDIDGRFFSYVINHKVNKDISRIAQGKSIVHIKGEEISKIQIKYPSDKEQQKILSFIELLSLKIEKQGQLIDKLKKYKRGVIKTIFDTLTPVSKSSIGKMATMFSGGTPRSDIVEYYNGSIPFIRSGEIHNDFTELHLSQIGLDNSSAKMVRKGDLLYALYGATSGEVDISKIDGAINQAILCIRTNEISSEYLALWLEINKNNILSKMLQGGQGNLSGELVKSLVVPIYSKTEEQVIVRIGNSINKLIDANTNMLYMLNKAKESLLQQIFI